MSAGLAAGAAGRVAATPVAAGWSTARAGRLARDVQYISADMKTPARPPVIRGRKAQSPARYCLIFMNSHQG
ncbi:hypothetical protein SXCC_02318 [Gluconacetobacter sp. SXCC-1]|nr:hypothetical protein SXCC_02318 [Gluconacetobacter sp. SXCC-1]